MKDEEREKATAELEGWKKRQIQTAVEKPPVNLTNRDKVQTLHQASRGCSVNPGEHISVHLFFNKKIVLQQMKRLVCVCYFPETAMLPILLKSDTFLSYFCKLNQGYFDYYLAYYCCPFVKPYLSSSYLQVRPPPEQAAEKNKWTYLRRGLRERSRSNSHRECSPRPFGSPGCQKRRRYGFPLVLSLCPTLQRKWSITSLIRTSE